MSYSEVSDFLETAEGEKMVTDACKKKFESIMNKIGGDKVIVQVGQTTVTQYLILQWVVVQQV